MISELNQPELYVLITCLKLALDSFTFKVLLNFKNIINILLFVIDSRWFI